MSNTTAHQHNTIHQLAFGGNSGIDKGQFEAVKNLVENHGVLLTDLDADQRIPLHWAVSGKHLDVVNYLIEKGSPIDLEDEEGWTPLMIAVSTGGVEIAKILLGKKANPNFKNKTKRAPLHYAASKNQYEIGQLLIEHGADVHATDELGQTAIFRAAALGYTRFVRLLKEAGAKINIRDGFNNSPLHLAIESEHGDTAVYLIEENADLDMVNKENKTPLQMTQNKSVLEFCKRRVEFAVGCVLIFFPNVSSPKRNHALSLRQLLIDVDRKDWISFEFGAPDKTLLPTKLINDGVSHRMGDPMAWCSLQYGPSLGDVRFRKELAKLLATEYQSPVDFNNLCVTNGASQSLQNILDFFTTPETIIFIQNPTYFLAIRIVRDRGFPSTSIIPIEMDNEGINIQQLELELEKHSDLKYSTSPGLGKFKYLMYLVPTFSNPTSSSLSEQRKLTLLELARKHDILIVCDDVYQLLHFENCKSVPKRLVEYDLSTLGSNFGNVISNCSFSKLLAPGLRLGWVEASHNFIAQFEKSALLYSGGCPNHFMSTVILSSLEMKAFQSHLTKLREIYYKRCQVAVQELQRFKKCEFIQPEGGYFIWIKLDLKEGLDTTKILSSLKGENSIEGIATERVSFTPGNLCSSNASHGNYLRISFAMYDEENLKIGIQRLIRVFETVCK
ncbi:hypothetical protein HDV06_005571 [Boothiomyces sp. JEL0866]|nr:hypothetical protein HDV06_005571 [Boothiomyces sp. JEL0866]